MPSEKNTIVRIKDIALKAKVSTGTVDRVIHNRGRVAEDVKERVLKILKELNYEPNLMARMLGSKKQYVFAALLPDHAFDAFWLAPKLGIEKAERDLKQYGVRVEQYVFNPHDPQDYVKKAIKLTKMQPDGVLLSPIYYNETLPFFKKWNEAKIPFVLFNTQIADYDPLSYIGQDSYQSGLVAAKLVHYGQANPCSILIAHIDEEINNAQHLVKKEQGFRNYFIQNNLSHHYNILRVELNRSSQSGFIKKLDEIIESTVDLRQIFVTTSQAYDIAKYLEQRHIKNIRLIGYDLIPPNLYYLERGDISFLINQNPKGQGYWGINQLAEHIVFKREVPILKYLPLDIVTAENLNYFIDEKDDAFVDI
ncbi:substrate-binding domain-containing protein [Mucilaginibacter xinganensis]|uniref:LacI family transcriptional regulator n=1 Tax=Mucilaginibacter xinganensis TaxID=1234841 RepID=A0A223NWN4_9SPHI|nr:LacI family DNA-binding transcriptional regulator [Mucilaginibacter xinganensis]ASU34114.1 LacI family transcriptional regulator [Mucilaginibacter xinganensis]